MQHKEILLKPGSLMHSQEEISWKSRACSPGRTVWGILVFVEVFASIGCPSRCSKILPQRACDQCVKAYLETA